MVIILEQNTVKIRLDQTKVQIPFLSVIYYSGNPDKSDLNLVIAFCSEKYRKKAEEVSNKILEENHSS